MSPTQLVYALLSADAALTGLVQGRVYPLRIPQNAALPAVAYQLVSSTETRLRGCTLPETGLVQVTVYAPSYAQVEAVSGAVRSALATDDVSYDNARDLHDDTAGVYYRPLDFRVQVPQPSV